MPVPALVLTGASGLVGRHLLQELRNEYRIFAIARRSQRECGAPVHPNIAWMRVDVGDRDGLARVFREIRTAGGAKLLLHLAAYYDFTGEDHPEYERTNVEGTRNVLELAETLELEWFFFASSVAACSFPRPEGPIDETTPPDGDHVYARSKREGEKLVLARLDRVRSAIVRFGAIYSDWCEYPPLYIFLNTWLAGTWRSRILAGRGRTAIPYVHIQDVVQFVQRLLIHRDRIAPGEVLVASSMGCASHLDLFRLATQYYYGESLDPIRLPKPLAASGLYAMNVAGKLAREMPFERPWMARYIDRSLQVDNTRTRARIDWKPHPRYRIERRLRFLIEALKSEPVEWNARNAEAMRKKAIRPELRIYQALMEIEDRVVERLIAQVGGPSGLGTRQVLRESDRSELEWFVRLLFRLLMTSVQASNRMLLLGYFEVIGRSRFEVGYVADDLCLVLQQLNQKILEEFAEMDELGTFGRETYDLITVPLEFAKDEIREQYERFLRAEPTSTPRREPAEDRRPAASRELLEETIWRCLAQRR